MSCFSEQIVWVKWLHIKLVERESGNHDLSARVEISIKIRKIRHFLSQLVAAQSSGFFRKGVNKLEIRAGDSPSIIISIFFIRPLPDDIKIKSSGRNQTWNVCIQITWNNPKIRYILRPLHCDCTYTAHTMSCMPYLLPDKSTLMHEPNREFILIWKHLITAFCKCILYIRSPFARIYRIVINHVQTCERVIVLSVVLRPRYRQHLHWTHRRVYLKHLYLLQQQPQQQQQWLRVMRLASIAITKTQAHVNLDQDCGTQIHST